MRYHLAVRRAPSDHIARTCRDLTSCVRRTTGDVPPGLVGFSSTTIGDKLYIFGGRLVHVRRMVNELRALDLNTLVWEKLWPLDGVSESEGPQPRYFHRYVRCWTGYGSGSELIRVSRSADAWGSKLVIFGGMGQSADQESQATTPENGGSSSDPNLSVLSDLLIYDTVSKEWSTPETRVRDGVEPPLPRYAHLSATSNGCLVILGGQDVLNQYIEQMCCLELESMTYVQSSEWKGHAGTYRSVAVSRQLSVHPGGASKRDRASSTFEDRVGRLSISNDDADFRSSTEVHSQVDESLQLPYTAPATAEEPVYTYTNYNFADVQRALDMISAPSSPDWQSTVCPLSELMTGAPSLPPGLRFPTAAMIGSHLVLTGTLITQQVSSFAIWTLDVSKVITPEDVANRPPLVWQRVDAGHALRSGSWNRAVSWRNSVVILGDRDRDIAIDYNRRQNNFTHAVFVDLEVSLASDIICES